MKKIFIRLKISPILFLFAVLFLVLAKPMLAATMEQGMAVQPLFPGQKTYFVSETSAWQYPGHEHEMVCCESEEPLSLAPAISQQSKLKVFLGADAVPRLLASIGANDASPSPKPSPGGDGVFLFPQKE